MNAENNNPRTSRYINHNWRSYLSILIIYTMLFPLPGKLSSVSDARADGANGSCELIGTLGQGGSVSFAPDPNDPDCINGGTIITGLNQTCSCNDGTTTTTDLNSTCASACQTHGGNCGILDCFVPPSGENQALPIAGIDYFNSNTAPLYVYAFDPDTKALVVNQAIHAIQPLGNLEFQAATDVLTDHGLPASDRNLVNIWARDLVRAKMMTKLVNIISKDAAARTADENVLYDWMTHLVWKQRIATAQIAWDQYRSWKYAAEFATCDWHSPSKDGIVTLTFDSTNNTFKNETKPGCSPGADGIPGNDPTPNQGSIEDFLAGRDDGETCFALPAEDSFVITSPDNKTPSYDSATKSRCAGAKELFFTGLEAHPSLEHFLEYGLAIARKNQIITPGYLSIIGNTYKDEAYGIGIAATATAGIATGASIYAKGGWAAYSKTIAPYAGRALFKAAQEGVQIAKAASTGIRISLRAVSSIAAATIILDIVGNIVTAVLTLLDIIEFNDIPVKLKAVVRAANGTAESTVTISENYKYPTGKPNLANLIATDAGKDEIRFALVEAMGPEKEFQNPPLAPLPDGTQFWAQKKQDGTVLSNFPLNQSLLVASWDVNKPFENMLVPLYHGWFSTQVKQPDGFNVTTGLSLGLDYKDCDGKQRRAWRVSGDEFVSMPMGATAAEFNVAATTKSKELQYLSSDPALGCLTARINHTPSPTGIVLSEANPKEGQAVTLTGTASDPDNDAVNMTWNFGDGTELATGSPIEHTFADSGSLQVVLWPIDVFGGQGATTKSQSITVANVAPTANFPTPTAVDEGSPFTLSLTNPTDPSSADTQAGFQYAFNCGTGFGSVGSSNTTSCPTIDNGNIAVAAKIRDKDGGETSYTANAQVNNVAPSIDTTWAIAGEFKEGSLITVQTTFSDPAGLRDTPFTCAMDFGDGTGSHAGNKVFGTTCTVSYAYSDNGSNFLVASIVTDKDNGEGRQTNRFGVIANVAPTATFTATTQIFQGESANLGFSQQADPSSVDTAAGFTYEYNCSANGTLAVANNRSATATCKYATAGTFTVGGTISDKDNGTTSYTASVSVISPQQAAMNLSTQIVALNLDATRTSDLTTKIDNALQKIAQGQKADAQKQLQDFIKKVNDIIRQKLITADQGQVLIDIANRIIASIAVS